MDEVMPVIETRDGLFDVSSLKYEAIINCLNCMQQINGRPASGLTRQNICMSPSNEVDTLIFMTLLSIVADVLQVRSVSSESVRLARRVQTIACRSEPESGDSQIDQQITWHTSCCLLLSSRTIMFSVVKLIGNAFVVLIVSTNLNLKQRAWFQKWPRAVRFCQIVSGVSYRMQQHFRVPDL